MSMEAPAAAAAFFAITGRAGNRALPCGARQGFQLGSFRARDRSRGPYDSIIAKAEKKTLTQVKLS